MTKITHKLPLQSLHTKLQNDIQCERPTQIGSKRLKTGVSFFFFKVPNSWQKFRHKLEPPYTIVSIIILKDSRGRQREQEVAFLERVK